MVVVTIGLTVWVGLGTLAALAIGRASAIGADRAPAPSSAKQHLAEGHDQAD